MAVLGLRSLKNIAADERPKSWREVILRKYPNGNAVLTPLLAVLESEEVEDPEFNWWEQGLPTRNAYINAVGGYAAGITTFTIDDSTGADPGILFRKGDILLVVRTLEHVRVTANQSAGTSVAVARAIGSTAAAALNDNDELRLIGHAAEEGADLGTALSWDPTKRSNYCQIFRNPLSITRTAKKTRTRSQDSYKKSKIDALEKFSMDMEQSFLWGEAYEGVGPDGEQIRTTRGVETFIRQYAPGNVFAVTGGTLNETELGTYLETVFKFGSTEKLVLAGARALNVFNQIAKAGIVVNVDSGDDVVYGVRLKRYRTPHGDLLFKQHPLFNLYTDRQQSALILDLANMYYRYVDDIQFLRDRQNPGQDKKVDEFIAECGLELHHADTFALLTGIASQGA